MSRLPAPSVGTENQGDGRKVNRPGVYVHDKAGAVIETSPLVPGHVQADALVQLGYRQMTDTEVQQYKKIKEDNSIKSKTDTTKSVVDKEK